MMHMSSMNDSWPDPYPMPLRSRNLESGWQPRIRSWRQSSRAREVAGGLHRPGRHRDLHDVADREHAGQEDGVALVGLDAAAQGAHHLRHGAHAALCVSLRELSLQVGPIGPDS